MVLFLIAILLSLMLAQSCCVSYVFDKRIAIFADFRAVCSEGFFRKKYARKNLGRDKG
jgi:hypothetical protein